jgi:hypothetical protein
LRYFKRLDLFKILFTIINSDKQNIVAKSGPLEAAKKRKYSPVPKVAYKKICNKEFATDFPKSFDFNKQYKDKIIVEAEVWPIDIELIAAKDSLDDEFK